MSDMLPRHYQEEVLDLARGGNVIAALDTGAGKTFIALLLLKWTSSVQPNSKSIFLVPKVALVEQQGEFIASHSALRVLKLHGALEIDLADRKGWKRKFETSDIFVMTPQIFLNLITHSLWTITKVSLIIFDECHHARKNHPYNGIMREYFEVAVASRPKIFGMTASPVYNIRDAMGALAALEANMDSKVVAVRNHVDELAAHVPKVSERIQQYPSPPERYDFPSPTLWMCLGVFTATLRSLNIGWEDIERRYSATLLNLGPYCASMYLVFELNHRLAPLWKDMAENGDLPPQSVPQDAEISQIREILTAHDDLFTFSSTVCLEWCSPKLRSLADVLISHGSNSSLGIIFVEQRQVAVSLARVLPCIPGLSGIRCAELVGSSDSSEGVAKNPGQATPESTVQSFREGRINLIIATAVAEEGLDFPACDLVIRFDPLQHMIGYVQSRGRARSQASTFVIMVDENDSTQLKKYQTFSEMDPELKAIYQSRRHVSGANSDDIMDEEEDIHPTDLAQRERYVVASTGAVLTFDNAIDLLSRLCALIPHDAFTSPHVPKYSGELQAIVQLPTSLGVSQQNLRYQGPLRLSKKEAKRAAAFSAVKRLHELDVFDQYLLPVSSARKGHEDNDGVPLIDISQVPATMRVSVRDPWTTDYSQRLWIHSIFIDNRRVAGLVTGTNLSAVELRCGELFVRTAGAEAVEFDRPQQREIMNTFTKECMWYRLIGAPVDHLTLYLVPIGDTGQPDFSAMHRLVSSPRGESNWDGIDESHYGRLMVMNTNLYGKPYLLKKICNDLSPASVPPDGSPEAGFPTYHGYWVQKWAPRPGRGKWLPWIPESGPLLELSALPRSTPSGAHSAPSATAQTQPAHVLFPRDCCRWINISEDIREAFDILPALYHKITDVYRAQQARASLSLPPISEDILIEALTLPCSQAGYSNQRLETLGDAVLQLCTTVHLFNKYPNRHEGQLSAMRQIGVCNDFLLSRAKDIGLEAFLTCETKDSRTWRARIQCPPSLEPTGRCISREFPRRSLQDCMEAILGASFLSGGIEMALHSGRALGLNFGGPTPWNIRYRIPQASPVPSVFSGLEEALGYSFRDGKLLVEALTHASFDNGTTNSYQRLEFLGDAVLDLVVIDYLYRKFPATCTSHELAWPRTRAICAPALAYVGVQHLKLHQLMLVNNVELSMEIERYVPQLEACSGEEIVQCGWRYDPPKALSDVFESVVGAVLVDSNYSYERTASVVEFVMQDVLEALTPNTRRDPITELIEWAAATSGCITNKQIVFKKTTSTSPGGCSTTAVATLVHGVVVADPAVFPSALVAKNLAAERALAILADSANEKSIARLCDCRKARAPPQVLPLSISTPEDTMDVDGPDS
ncbi:hypothetical protein C8F04DRAFT_1287110 [Mycena alexandri]|uniref:Dicer-like protein 2 n=1 Tax=Mycena alexandri TaxID=1745969 RepID=A0AAD6XCA3_9AGAR|nr:hypothetical protein C8F04DRAFT_1287110 [Mycena alexandri]